MAAVSPFAPVVGRLGCLRGVSVLTAFGLAVEIGDWHRFTGATAPVETAPEQGGGEHGAEGGFHAGPPAGGVPYGADERLDPGRIEVALAETAGEPGGPDHVPKRQPPQDQGEREPDAAALVGFAELEARLRTVQVAPSPGPGRPDAVRERPGPVPGSGRGAQCPRVSMCSASRIRSLAWYSPRRSAGVQGCSGSLRTGR